MRNFILFFLFLSKVMDHINNFGDVTLVQFMTKLHEDSKVNHF